jgi:hypothetical protein
MFAASSLSASAPASALAMMTTSDDSLANVNIDVEGGSAFEPHSFLWDPNDPHHDFVGNDSPYVQITIENTNSDAPVEAYFNVSGAVDEYYLYGLKEYSLDPEDEDDEPTDEEGSSTSKRYFGNDNPDYRFRHQELVNDSSGSFDFKATDEDYHFALTYAIKHGYAVSFLVGAFADLEESEPDEKITFEFYARIEDYFDSCDQCTYAIERIGGDEEITLKDDVELELDAADPTAEEPAEEPAEEDVATFVLKVASNQSGSLDYGGTHVDYYSGDDDGYSDYGHLRLWIDPQVYGTSYNEQSNKEEESSKT